MVENKDDLAKRFNFDDWESFMDLDVDELVEPSASILKRPVNSQRSLTLTDDQKERFGRLKLFSERMNSYTLERVYPGITDFAITYRLFTDEKGEPEYTAQDIVELIDEEFGHRTNVSWIYRHTSQFLNREE